MPLQHLMRDPLLFVLMAASLVSWAIIIDCLLVLSRASRADKAFLEGARSESSPLSAVRQEIRRHEPACRDHLLTIADTTITIQRQKMERALPLLGVIGSTAPYVGLLGTVIGIIQSFQAIQVQNNMSPSIVAGGIATALIATACGLGVAIPAVAAHHLITSAIGRRVSEWESTAAEWLSESSVEGARHESVARA